MGLLDPAGYVARDLDQVLDRLRADLRSELGDVNLDAGSVLGTITGIFAEALADVWKSTQAIYDAFNIDNADGQQLDDLLAIIGLRRFGELRSSARVTLTGSGTALVPAGSILATTTGARVVTLADANVGDSGIDVEAVEAGPVVITGTLDPVTTITGWTGATVGSSQTGRFKESDAEFRLRAYAVPDTIGAATVEAIKGVLQTSVPGIRSALVIENVTDFVDGNGLPPLSFRAYLHPDTLDPADIWAALWKSKPAGMRTSGSQSHTANDSMGHPHALYWDWSDPFPVEWRLTLVKGPSWSGDVQDVKDVVSAYMATLGVNDAVQPWRCQCLIVAAFPNITDVTVEVSPLGAGSWTSAALPVDPFTIAILQGGDADIGVTLV